MPDAPLPSNSTRPMALPMPAGGLRCGAAAVSAVAAAVSGAETFVSDFDVDDDVEEEVVEEDGGEDDGELQPPKTDTPITASPGRIRCQARVFIVAIFCHSLLLNIKSLFYSGRISAGTN